MNILKKTFHKWSCKCPSNISPAVLSRGLRFWLSCAGSTNWNWGLFSKCHVVCDFGSLGVHPWSFMCTLFLQWLQSWGSSGNLSLDQKNCFLLFRPISPSLTGKDKCIWEFNPMLWEQQENMYPKGILTGKESRKQCWLLQWWQCNGRYKILGYVVEYDQFLVIIGRPNHQNEI